MKRLLIANRGEIAVRIARTAADMGLATAAVFSQDDAASPHLAVTDAAIALPGRGPRAYLDIAAVVAAAEAAGADAIHPGYGFLAENAALARAAQAAGLVFVGPDPETLDVFGDKVRARALAAACGAPVLSGAGPVDESEARAFLAGLPAGRAALIKAAAGGGGRGLRLVRREEELADAFAAAAREAGGAFGDARLYVEAFMENARHIEVQVLGDGAAVSALGERECSLQRRHQKLVEVAPSPSLTGQQRERITAAALEIARAAAYRNAGTLEFLLDRDTGDFAFIEANARLQVEHTVTEETLGVDLVRAQLEIAAGASLADIGLDQPNAPRARGYAIQCRINLESVGPDGAIRPAAGKLSAFCAPTGPGVRTDTFLRPGYEVSPAFDTLGAKVVCASPSDDYGVAVRRVRRALRETVIEGPASNLAFLRALLDDERVAANDVDTAFIDRHGAELVARAQVFEPASHATAAAPTSSRPVLDLPDDATALRSPMAGVVSGLAVTAGELVRAGAVVANLEAMKMEHAIRAETDGVVKEVLAAVGLAVDEGDPLLLFDAVDSEVGELAEDHAAATTAWRPDLDELARREELGRAMGGPEGIERQHRQGKLTVRERIDALADPGSFREFMTLSGDATYEDGELTRFAPKNFVNGTIELNGRKAFVTGGDFTVRGGAGGSTRGGMGQELSVTQRALEWRLPYVRLLDAAGGSVRTFEEIGRTYLPDGNAWTKFEVQALSVVPTVSAVLGSVAGLPAIYACLAHFNVMVKGKSQIFPGGPPVVKAALGVEITKEELGGDQIHTRLSGCVNNLAQDESDAFDQIRRFLSYLPDNVWEAAPRGAAGDETTPNQDALLSIVPRGGRQSYDGRALLKTLADRDSFFELSPLYGRARITGLARIDGWPVGIMANNPRFNGGLTDRAAGAKVVQLLQLCDTFHLPIVDIADEPGFMVGIEAEQQGIERAGARLAAMVCNSRTPWITVVVGKLYGVAGQCHHRPSGMFRRYAWPSANWGSMHITGGVSAAYRREIEAAADPDAKRREIERRLQAFASPFRTAEATGQDIIDPRQTRERLVEFVRDAQRVLATHLGPPPAPYLP